MNATFSLEKKSLMLLLLGFSALRVNLFIDSPFITKMKLIGAMGVRDESGIPIDFSQNATRCMDLPKTLYLR